MPARNECSCRVSAERVSFVINDVRQPLRMDTRCLNGLGDRHAMINDIEHHLQDAGRDMAAPRRAKHHGELAALGDDSWAHRRKRTLARRDGVVNPFDKAKTVGHPWFGRKIIHFIVEEYPCARRGHACAEPVVERVGQ